MTEQEWWTEWCVTWGFIGWRALVGKSNYNIDDVLDVCAALLMRVSQLEAKASRFFFGLF